MEIIHNVMSPEVFHKVRYDAYNLWETDPNGYFTSDEEWTDNLKDGYTGTCYCRQLDGDRYDLIFDDIKHKLPTTENVSLLYYVWDVHSGIQWHNDGYWDWAGSIYLDDGWKPEWGGIFLWKTLYPEYAYHAHIPTANTMSLNTLAIPHCVTPVLENALCPRFSIQVFCKSCGI